MEENIKKKLSFGKIKMNKELVEKLQKRTLNEDLIANLKKRAHDYIQSVYKDSFYQLAEEALDGIVMDSEQICNGGETLENQLMDEFSENGFGEYNPDWSTKDVSDLADYFPDFHALVDRIADALIDYEVNVLFKYADNDSLQESADLSASVPDLESLFDFLDNRFAIEDVAYSRPDYLFVTFKDISRVTKDKLEQAIKDYMKQEFNSEFIDAAQFGNNSRGLYFRATEEGKHLDRSVLIAKLNTFKYSGYSGELEAPTTYTYKISIQ